mmetsp:Transcript_83384/g.234484  ORF Transcript_83384/g.234484 Transcript_83384/m.234484 type:complete len:117 (+) Transcript_83384:1-351(+)
MPRPASMACLASTADTPDGHAAGFQVRAPGMEQCAWILGKAWSPPLFSSKSSGGLAAPLLFNEAEFSTPPLENQSPLLAKSDIGSSGHAPLGASRTGNCPDTEGCRKMYKPSMDWG